MKPFLLASALALLAGGAWAQDVVRIGTEGAYPPYNYLNDAGELEGFEIDLAKELCARAELSCEFVQNEWDSIIPNLSSGNYDAIMAGMGITAEREEVIAFTQNYVPPSPSLYVGLSDDVDVTTGVVAAQTNTLQAAHVAESGATLLEFATQDEALAAVQAGEADAFFADAEALEPAIEAAGGSLVPIGEPLPIGGGVAIGLRQSDTELKDKLDAAITSMKEDGSLNELLATWFGEDPPQY